MHFIKPACVRRLLAGCSVACWLAACRSSGPAVSPPDADVPQEAAHADDQPLADARPGEAPPTLGPNTVFPFVPVAGEAKVEKPCGPNGRRCIVVMDGGA